MGTRAHLASQSGVSVIHKRGLDKLRNGTESSLHYRVLNEMNVDRKFDAAMVKGSTRLLKV